jgi:hypothetical protein
MRNKPRYVCGKCRKWITAKKNGKPWAHLDKDNALYCDGDFEYPIFLNADRPQEVK